MYITLALCGFMFAFRVYSEGDPNQNLIVFLINFVALGYVFNIIIGNVYSELKGRCEKSQFCKKQFGLFKSRKNCFWAGLVVVALCYIFLAYKFNFINTVGGIVNDAMSIVALGFSIEDQRIKERLLEHYENIA